MKKRSWKTAGSGLAALLSTAAIVLQQMTDADPGTNPDWPSLMPGIIAAFGLIFARQNNLSSQDVGVRPVVTPAGGAPNLEDSD